jgi:hypothetical protein
MIADLMDILFGCWHSNYSFPLTAKGSNRAHSAAQATGTYVACLDCGREFPYDWKTMQVVSGKPVDNNVEFPEIATAPSLARKQAA